mgnify:CR=1 FL=1
MRLTTSYKMKLTGDFKALETSIAIYRQTLTYLIPIINDNWKELSQYEFSNQKYNQIEKWIHSTQMNHARYDFDQKFPKLPNYLRRSAISKALGVVSSYRSNLTNWEANPEGQAPKLQLVHYEYPAYYKGVYLEALTQSIKPLSLKFSKTVIGYLNNMDSNSPIAPITSAI